MSLLLKSSAVTAVLALSMSNPQFVSAHSDISSDVSAAEIATEVRQLDTPREQFDKAVEMGMAPDSDGLIEFDEPIGYETANGEQLPVWGVIDPSSLDAAGLGSAVDFGDLKSLDSTKELGTISPAAVVTCTENNTYYWRGAGVLSTTCFTFPGGTPSGQYRSITGVCTNIYGWYSASTVYRNTLNGAFHQSPWRSGTGCWNFTNRVYGVRAIIARG